MAPKKGDLFLLKVGDGESVEVFTTVAGLRPTSMTINGNPVDVTHKGSEGWRELLPGGGIKSIDITAGGVYLGDGSQTGLRAKCIAGTLHNMQIDDGDDVVECSFQVASYEQAGGHGEEQNFTVSLQSAGEPTVTSG